MSYGIYLSIPQNSLLCGRTGKEGGPLNLLDHMKKKKNVFLLHAEAYIFSDPPLSHIA